MAAASCPSKIGVGVAKAVRGTLTRSTVGSANWVEPLTLKQPMMPSLLTSTWSVCPSQMMRSFQLVRGRRAL